MTAHLAVLHREYLDKVIAGDKTIEMRLTKTRRAPFGKIHAGHTIYFKQSSGPIRAVATADRVETLTDLDPRRIRAIRRDLNKHIAGSSATWQLKLQARYGTLIWLRDVRPTSLGPVVGPLYGAAWVCDPHERAARISA